MFLFKTKKFDRKIEYLSFKIKKWIVKLNIFNSKLRKQIEERENSFLRIIFNFPNNSAKKI